MPDDEHCPGAESAAVADTKLTYLLNDDPEVSGGKAACFHKLGFNTTNSSELKETLLAELPVAPLVGSRTNKVGGTNYEVKMTLTGPDGTSADFRTIWTNTTGTVEFVTAYPWRDKKETTTLS